MLSPVAGRLSPTSSSITAGWAQTRSRSISVPRNPLRSPWCAVLYTFGGRNAALPQPVYGAKHAAAFLQSKGEAGVTTVRPHTALTNRTTAAKTRINSLGSWASCGANCFSRLYDELKCILPPTPLVTIQVNCDFCLT